MNKKDILTACFIAVVGISIYFNALHGEFVNDDYKHILQNPSIHNLFDVSAVWDSFNTRFIPGLSFAFNYWLGKFDVFGYHLFNIVIHISAAISVFVFVQLILQTPHFQNNRITESSRLIAFFSALIFLCHPIQTQSVAYVSQRFASMATFFYLLSLIFYIKARLQENKRYLWLALCMMVLGIFTKEMTVTIPLMILVCEFFFFGPPRQDWKKRARWIMPFWLGLALFPLILMQNRPDSVTQIKYAASLSQFDWNYLFTEINVLRTYLRLLILPAWQVFSYDYPIAQGFWQASTVYSFSLLLGLMALAVFWFKRQRLLSFAILWFFVATSVEAASVVFGNRGVIYENWLYLPVIGFAVFLTVSLITLSRRAKWAQIVLTFIVIIFSVLTIQRNRVYQTEVAFWEDIVKKQPNGYHCIELAFAYQRIGELDRAIVQLHKALALDENYLGARIELGNIHMLLHQYNEAIKQYEKALAKNPRFYDGKVNLGRAYGKVGKVEPAFEQLNEAVQLKPENAQAYYFLGTLTEKLGYDERAEQYYLQALKYDKQMKEAFYQLGRLSLNRKQYAKSITLLEHALKLDPDYAIAYNALGVAYVSMDRLREGERAFLAALKLNPSEPDVYKNLVIYYKRLNDTEKAEHYFDQLEALTNNE